MANNATANTGGLLSHLVDLYDLSRPERQQRFVRFAERLSTKLQSTGATTLIEDYSPYLENPSAWLTILETRIRDSILPSEYDEEPSTEWLSEEVGYAAIAFLRGGADILPAEPHIYGTQSGDLVAEFETKDGQLTTIVSSEGTILFAAMAEVGTSPIQAHIPRGSNHARADLEAFIAQFYAGGHGKKVERPSR